MTTLHSITTVAGHNKEAAQKAQNRPVVFTHIALGDDARFPTGGETALGSEQWRGVITDKGIVPGEPNATFFDVTVPASVPTFNAQEIGLFDEDGVLYALSRFDRPIPKFGPGSANQSAFTFRIIVVFSATANIVVEVDAGWKQTIDAQLRPDFRSAEAIRNAPPATPEFGQTWIVGAAPTGIWGGHANQLAEWTKAGWAFVPPTPWMHMGLADKTDWRWDGTDWVKWEASQTVAGPVRLATISEAADAANAQNPITPASLPERLGAGYREAKIYTTSSVWTKPVTNRFIGIEIRIIGGGGSGGVSNSSTDQPLFGGGGSNGAEIVDYFKAADLSLASYPVTVGAGGASVSAATGPAGGNPGGVSGGFGLQANGGLPGSGLGGLHGAGGNSQSTGTVRPGKSLLISGTRGGDGFEIAGITFPTSMGSIGQGGQGGYKTVGGPNSASGAGGNGVVMITEIYV